MQALPKLSHSTRVVIAIDFGTSRSGYAYAFADDQQIVGRTQWAGQSEPYIKTLTHLLYTPEREVEAWGYEAGLRLAQLRQGIAAKDYPFFKSFKMQLQTAKEQTENGPIIESHGQKFLVLDLIADYLKQLKELVLSEIKEATSGFLKDTEILWCLTIPAIWRDVDKQLMRRAAQQAGMIGAGNLEAERLLLVLEPEAAAIYCQERDKGQLNPGTRFMVVDCGGGTIDITVHEVATGGGLHEVVPGTGGAFGSTYVDATFLEFLKAKLTSNAIEQFQAEDPIEYVQMWGEWERIKCNFVPQQKGSEITYFPIRTKLHRKLKQQYPEVLKQLADKQEGDDTDLYLDQATMASFFAPTLTRIVQTVRAQLAKLGDRGCDILFLVGGYSTSPVLQQRIKQEFQTSVKRIVTPPMPGAAIVQGAVSFGLNPSTIRSRRSRLTYGCKSAEEYDPERDAGKPTQWLKEKQVEYCENRFTPFVQAGQKVELDEKVVRTFQPLSSKQTQMHFQFYATANQNVRHTDEVGVHEIGEMTIEMPDLEGGLDRTVEVTMYFGTTEIKVEGNDLTSGQACQTTLRFSSSY